MIKIDSDKSKNRLYVTIKGVTTANELRSIAPTLLQETGKLTSGFGVISDIAECKPSDEEARLVMAGIMADVKKAGIGHVIRVIPAGEARITGNQWQRTSRNAAGYSAEEAPSLEEAEKLLDLIENK